MRLLKALLRDFSVTEVQAVETRSREDREGEGVANEVQVQTVQIGVGPHQVVCGGREVLDDLRNRRVKPDARRPESSVCAVRWRHLVPRVVEQVAARAID